MNLSTELIELLAAAKAVVSERSECQDDDIIRNIDPELDRLRDAVDSVIKLTTP